jgi:hypothetical protein
VGLFEGHPFRQAAEILDQIRPAFSVDLLVRTAEQLDGRLALGDFFLREVVTKGKVLYESVAPVEFGGSGDLRSRSTTDRSAMG